MPAADAGFAEPVQPQEGFLGVILPRQAIDLAAPLTGRLEAVYVRPGDRVGPGQVLVRLDGQSLGHELERARATLRETAAEQSRAELALAEAESRQRRRLAIPESFSKEDLAAAEIQRQSAVVMLEGARARRAGVEAAVRQAETALNQLELRAPFAGTVALRYLDDGATVGSGTPVLRLVTSGELIVRFAVSLQDTRTLRREAAVLVSAPELPAEIRGTVERIAPEVDPASQLVFVEARLQSPPSVEPGTPVRVTPAPPAPRR